MNTRPEGFLNFGYNPVRITGLFSLSFTKLLAPSLFLLSLEHPCPLVYVQSPFVQSFVARGRPSRHSSFHLSLPYTSPLQQKTLPLQTEKLCDSCSSTICIHLPMDISPTHMGPCCHLFMFAHAVCTMHSRDPKWCVMWPSLSSQHHETARKPLSSLLLKLIIIVSTANPPFMVSMTCSAHMMTFLTLSSVNHLQEQFPIPCDNVIPFGLLNAVA